jgi:hypothetical protein
MIGPLKASAGLLKGAYHLMLDPISTSLYQTMAVQSAAFFEIFQRNIKAN